MDFWFKEARKKLKEGGMKILMMDKYVDDILAIMGTLKLGSRWVENRVEYLPEWEEIDRRLERSEQEVTMQALLACSNDILGFLNFTGVLSQGEGQPVPCLDTQLWWGKANQYHRDSAPPLY